MQEALENIRRQIDEIRKSGKFAFWRMVYADNLLNRANEYLAVDRQPEARKVLDKLEKWVQNHKPRLNEKPRFVANEMIFWNKDLLLQMCNRLKNTLVQKKLLVPATERDSILRRLQLVENWIEQENFLEAHGELLSLRGALIARLRRSFRARLVATNLYKGSVTPPKGSLVGPYNALHTLEETFHVVGERDPIWVEDFLDVYNQLFKVVESLIPENVK